MSASAVAGARHVIACLVLNGPLAEPRGGIFLRYATLAFESPGWPQTPGPLSVSGPARDAASTSDVLAASAVGAAGYPVGSLAALVT